MRPEGWMECAYPTRANTAPNPANNSLCDCRLRISERSNVCVDCSTDQISQIGGAVIIRNLVRNKHEFLKLTGRIAAGIAPVTPGVAGQSSECSQVAQCKCCHS